MSAVFSLALFALLMLTISYVGYLHYARPGRFYERLGATVLPAEDRPPGGWRDGVAVRIIRQIGERVPLSPQGASLTRRTLIAAGYRWDGASSVYYGIRFLAALNVSLAAFLLADYITDNVVQRIGLLAAAGLAGYFIPSLVLDRLVGSRQESLRLSLPDALDLMVVCVEAGLGLDQAILNVSQELARTHHEISEELRLVTLEMRAGKPRAEALRNLASRTGEPELRKLTAILIQTDRFGTSIADSLRTHADFMRVRRRQQAEERAGKVGVKLVFPIFFCVLPAMLVVVAGPGLLQIFKELFPMMRQFGIPT